MRILVLVACLASGCAYNRVALGDPLPRPDAPLKERVKAFKQYSIQAGQQTTYLRNGIPQGTSVDFVLLGDGTRIEDVRDLAPLVEPNSPSGRYIEQVDSSMRSASTVASVLGWTALGSTVAGLAIGTPLLMNRDSVGAGAAIMGILGGIGYLLANIYIFPATAAARGPQDIRLSALMTFNQSLRDKLALDDDSLEEELERKQQRKAPSVQLMPAGSAWLAAFTR